MAKAVVPVVRDVDGVCFEEGMTKKAKEKSELIRVNDRGLFEEKPVSNGNPLYEDVIY